jgi:hypothetical protein
LLVALAVGGACRPGRAQDADPYSATIKVDATADTVIKAREAARLDGQRRALAAIAERLAAGGTPPKMPKLDDNAITAMVASFEVANERMSAVRYVADYTFHFQPAAIQRVLHVSASAAADPTGKPPAAAPAEASGKPAVVIPVYQSGGDARLWEDPNPWRDAWDKAPASGSTPLVEPLGDAGDIAALDAGKAVAGDSEGLAAIAQRNGADDAIVALAAMKGPPDQPSGVEIAVRRYRGGKLVDSHVAPLTANSGESEADLLRRAVSAVVTGVQGGWKKETVAGYDQQGTLTAVLPIDSLDDWVRARQRMAGVPAIRTVSLMALSRQEATIEIGYVGTIDQLKSNLAGINLDLTPGGPAWRLARTASDRAMPR